MLNLQRIIFNFVFDLHCFERMKFIYLLCVCFVDFCILANKESIADSFCSKPPKKRKEKRKTDDGYEESQGKHDVIR